MSPRQEGRIGRARQRTGRAFQDSLERMHARWREKGLGFILHVPPRTVYTDRGLVFARGGAPPDYVGVFHARLAFQEGQPVPRTVPVLFDAKVLDRHAKSYRHDPDEEHQLGDLITFQRAGFGVAFLLIQDRLRERAYVVTGLDAFAALLTRQAVPLIGEGDFPLVPVAAYHPMTGYDWRPAVCLAVDRDGPFLPPETKP